MNGGDRTDDDGKRPGREASTGGRAVAWWMAAHPRTAAAQLRSPDRILRRICPRLERHRSGCGTIAPSVDGADVERAVRPHVGSITVPSRESRQRAPVFGERHASNGAADGIGRWIGRGDPIDAEFHVRRSLDTTPPPPGAVQYASRAFACPGQAPVACQLDRRERSDADPRSEGSGQAPDRTRMGAVVDLHDRAR